MVAKTRKRHQGTPNNDDSVGKVKQSDDKRRKTENIDEKKKKKGGRKDKVIYIGTILIKFCSLINTTTKISDDQTRLFYSISDIKNNQQATTC